MLGFDVAEPGDARLGAGLRVVGHAVEQHRKSLVAGPRAAAAQRFEAEERALQAPRLFDRALRAKLERVRRLATIQ